MGSLGSDGITILGTTSYVDDLGYLHVFGEVRNDGINSQNYVKITSTFYDSQDVVVTTDFAYTILNIIQYGKSIPFEVVVNEKNIVPQISSYSMQVSSRDASYEVPNLTILSNSSYVDGLGYLHVPGEIRNDNQQCQDYVKIAGTFYGSDVVFVEFTYTEIDLLTPGQFSPFELVVSEDTIIPNIHDFLLQAESCSEDKWPYVGEGSLKIRTNSSYTDGLGYLHIVGEVENKGQLTAEWVKVVSTYYNEQDTVIGTSYAYADPKTISPGGMSPFEVVFSDTGFVPTINSYALGIDTRTTIQESFVLITCISSLVLVVCRWKIQQ